MKQGIAKVPDLQGKEVLRKRLAAVEQSAQARRQAQTAMAASVKQVEELGRKLSREQNTDKRRELVNQLQQMTKPMMEGKLPAAPFAEQPRPGIGKPLLEQAPRAVTEPDKQLDLKRKEEAARQQAEQKRQEQLQQQRAREQRQQAVPQRQWENPAGRSSAPQRPSPQPQFQSPAPSSRPGGASHGPAPTGPSPGGQGNPFGDLKFR